MPTLAPSISQAARCASEQEPIYQKSCRPARQQSPRAAALAAALSLPHDSSNDETSRLHVDADSTMSSGFAPQLDRIQMCAGPACENRKSTSFRMFFEKVEEALASAQVTSSARTIHEKRSSSDSSFQSSLARAPVQPRMPPKGLALLMIAALCIVALAIRAVASAVAVAVIVGLVVSVAALLIAAVGADVSGGANAHREGERTALARIPSVFKSVAQVLRLRRREERTVELAEVSRDGCDERLHSAPLIAAHGGILDLEVGGESASSIAADSNAFSKACLEPMTFGQQSAGPINFSLAVDASSNSAPPEPASLTAAGDSVRPLTLEEHDACDDSGSEDSMPPLLSSHPASERNVEPCSFGAAGKMSQLACDAQDTLVIAEDLDGKRNSPSTCDGQNEALSPSSSDSASSTDDLTSANAVKRATPRSESSADDLTSANAVERASPRSEESSAAESSRSGSFGSESVDDEESRSCSDDCRSECSGDDRSRSCSSESGDEPSLDGGESDGESSGDDMPPLFDGVQRPQAPTFCRLAAALRASSPKQMTATPRPPRSRVVRQFNGSMSLDDVYCGDGHSQTDFSSGDDLSSDDGLPQFVLPASRVSSVPTLWQLQLGVRVELRNLRGSPHMNGKRGVIHKLDPEECKIIVKLDAGRIVGVSSKNVFGLDLSVRGSPNDSRCTR